MSQVIKNADDTFTVTFTAREQKTLKRWGDENTRTKAAQLENVINGFMANKRQDYRGLDGPTMRDQYEALTAEQQAAIDAILATVPTV